MITLDVKRRTTLIKECESKTNLTTALVAAGFSFDDIQNEMSRDRKQERGFQISNDNQNTKSDDANLSLDSDFQGVVNYDEKSESEDEECTKSDYEKVIIAERQQRDEDDQ